MYDLDICHLRVVPAEAWRRPGPTCQPLLWWIVDTGLRRYDGHCGRAPSFEKVPKIQIITLAELFQGMRPRIPRIDVGATFRTAARETAQAQERLL